MHGILLAKGREQDMLPVESTVSFVVDDRLI